jgi:hypothetical protein
MPTDVVQQRSMSDCSCTYAYRGCTYLYAWRFS